MKRRTRIGRADALLHDPMGADLVGRIAYDFQGRFGRSGAAQKVPIASAPGGIAAARRRRGRYHDAILAAFFRPPHRG